MFGLSAEWAMGFILGGMVLLLVASVLEALWDFGRLAKPEFCPAFLRSGWRHVILVGCILLLLIGGSVLFWADFRVGLGAIVVYFLLLPFVVGSRVRRRFLPPWHSLKRELEEQGYTEHNYWRRGDWWKAGSKSKLKSESKQKTGM
jgi:hypothetical protein